MSPIQHRGVVDKYYVNLGSQVRFLASPEPLLVEPSGAPVIKYTHESYPPSPVLVNTQGKSQKSGLFGCFFQCSLKAVRCS